MTNGIRRAINHSDTVFSAAEIAHLGFGKTEVLHRVGNDLLSDIRPRQFCLRCGCVVSQASECGSPCLFCLRELEQTVGVEAMIALTPVDMEWLSRPCAKNHQRECAYPFCPSKGICANHGAVADDGKTYCPPHYIEVQDTLKLHVMKENIGVGGVGMYKFFRSLFFK